MRGVAGYRDAPGVEPAGDAVLDQEPRAPDDVVDDRPLGPGPRVSTRFCMKPACGSGGASATFATSL
jgi:hypothetical protein